MFTAVTFGLVKKKTEPVVPLHTRAANCTDSTDHDHGSPTISLTSVVVFSFSAPRCRVNAATACDIILLLLSLLMYVSLDCRYSDVRKYRYRITIVMLSLLRARFS